MRIITVRQLRHRWTLYLLLLPSLAFICTFAYFPAVSATYHSLYKWDGDDREQFNAPKNFAESFTDEWMHWGFFIVITLVAFNLFKMVPSIATAVMVHRMTSERARYIYRILFVIPMIIPIMVWLLVWKFIYNPTFGPLNDFLEVTGLMEVLRAFGRAVGTDAFETDSVSWLGHPHLAYWAYVLWGFPWLQVVSVLIYLSGLGNIDQSVYDAAEIDGCGWFRKFWNIELPLIMTQVRLNLILMVIGTLKGWGLIFILYGDEGGANGVLNVPGLYMFYNAFNSGRAGYACAIGLLLFVLILGLTWFNNRYIRVSR